MKEIDQEYLHQFVNASVPERLSPETNPPITEDHAAHLLQLVRWGQTTLAADHLLFPEMNGILVSTVTELIRQLNILFATSRPFQSDPEDVLKQKIRLRQYAYETLLEIVLNFHGLESRWLREEEKRGCLRHLFAVIDEWETREHDEGRISIAGAVVSAGLAKMKRVQKGVSMVAKTALRLEEDLDIHKHVLTHFLKKAEDEIKGNIYYRMVKEGRCKFGNDYALGLRWLRHLGFEQVSTNPVLAARAYQDEPALTGAFREELRRHPHFKAWSSHPEKYADEITLFATLLALWDNLYVFRPLFFNLRESSGGGVVSFQLNPNIAHRVEESIRDVFQAFSLASENLSIYDRYLLAGFRMDGERGRPNMVIKVAATTPAARTITRTINRFGFGSNITVDYSVSQEATLILEEMAGMASAVRKGIRPTQLYMTNMGGRLESHLREVKLEELFQELKRKITEGKATRKVELLSETNGTKEKVAKAKTYEEKVLAATRFAHGQKVINDPVCDALADVISREALKHWEEAIGRAGTLVVRRIWEIFFSERNRERWVEYLMKKENIGREEARRIMDRIHCLPASKRKPFDTLWTLAPRNLVHTEFPDHQENVRKMAEGIEFHLDEYADSISKTFPPEVLDRLNALADFKKAYDINPELEKIFHEVGIEDEWGRQGLAPSEWSEFGPVQKTLSEFKAAYDGFQIDMISVLKEFGRKNRKPKAAKKENPGRSKARGRGEKR